MPGHRPSRALASRSFRARMPARTWARSMNRLLHPVGPAALCAVLALAAACGGDGSRSALVPLALPEGCNPLLGGGDCFLPYPSDFFRVPDSTATSGARIETRGAAKLAAADGSSADVSDWRPIQGYSRSSTVLGTLLAPTADAGLVGFFDSPGETLAVRSSATLIVDAASGELVPHFADLDPRANDASRQAIALHPVVPLGESRRYIVAFHGLVSPTGADVPAPEGFRRIRDGEAAGDTALAPLVARYESDVFPPLEALGLPRAEIQLAWDFTTGSDLDVTGDMRRVRELALAWLASHTPEITIDDVEEHAPGDGSGLWRTVSGTVRGPRFVDSPDPGARLTRDGDGRVRQDGTVAFPFLAQIPERLRDPAAGVGRVIGLGHGFFGTRNEVRSASAIQSANALGAVVTSIDWWGMSVTDAPGVVLSLVGNPARATLFTDRVHQAIANWLTFTVALRGPLVGTAAFQRPGTEQSVYDPSRVDFWGLSNGAILGTVQSAMNPWSERVCLNVGGAGWSQMMWRSGNFVPFLLAASLSIPDPLVQQEYVASIQRHMDRIDPATYAPLFFDPELPQNPADRHVVLQMGLGDAGVPNVGSFYLARALGAAVTMPTAAPIWGVDPVVGFDARAGVTVFDMGVDASFEAKASPPLAGNVVHDGVRLLAAADRQLDALFSVEGRVIHPCDGPCDPE